jgi:hypothetical protein
MSEEPSERANHPFIVTPTVASANAAVTSMHDAAVLRDVTAVTGDVMRDVTTPFSFNRLRYSRARSAPVFGAGLIDG